MFLQNQAGMQATIMLHRATPTRPDAEAANYRTLPEAAKTVAITAAVQSRHWHGTLLVLSSGYTHCRSPAENNERDTPRQAAGSTCQ
jgi:hypothetical protein